MVYFIVFLLISYCEYWKVLCYFDLEQWEKGTDRRKKKTILGKIITISQAFQIYEIYWVAFILLLLPLLYFSCVKFYKRNLFYFKSHSFRQVLWSIKWIEIHKTTNKYHSYDNWNYYYWLFVYAFAILYRVSKLLLFIALNQYFTWFDFW